MRIAVLDLGTNTFNLLIVDVQADGKFTKIFNEKLAPKIGLGGINEKRITNDAFNRGIESLVIQKGIIESYQTDKVYVFGTSAIRNALNGADFVKAAFEKTGIEIHVITGNQEAEYIYFGNRKAVDFGNETVLILDIGGGSNECIIANNDYMLWKQSFEIGVSRIMQMFSISDPISAKNIEQIESYVDQKLAPLYDAVVKFPVSVLIGSSGAFDTFRAMIRASKGLPKIQDASYELAYTDFITLKQILVTRSQVALLAIPGMDPMRVDMIGIAAIFVDFLMRKLALKRIIQSQYSLKEGVIYSLSNET